MVSIVVILAAEGGVRQMDVEDFILEMQKKSKIDDSLTAFLRTSGQRYVYGNGLQTAVCLGIFRDIGLQIHGMILPPGSEVMEYNGYWGRLLRRVDKYAIGGGGVQHASESGCLCAAYGSERGIRDCRTLFKGKWNQAYCGLLLGT